MTTATALMSSVSRRWTALPQAVQFSTALFAVTRFIYSLWAIFILSLQPASAKAPQPVIHNAFEQWFLAPWYRWDAVWFLKIAQEGYSVVDGRSAYYPLYPLLTRLVGDLLGGNYLLSGLIVSNLATWGSLILLYILTERHFGEVIARRTVVVLALYPFYIFNLVYYADSLVLLFSLATFLMLETGRWGWVGVFASLTVLSKLPGLVIMGPIAWEFLAQRRRWWSTDLLAVASVPLTIGVWTVALRFIGSEVALSEVSSPFALLTPIFTPSFQQKFEVFMVWPWQGLILGFQAIPALWGKVLVLKVILDVVMVLFFTATIPFTLKLPRFSYFVFCLGLYLMNLTMVMPSFPLADFPRRMIVAFPVFMVLALWMQRHRWVDRLVVLIGLCLSALVSALLLWWVWIG